MAIMIPDEIVSDHNSHAEDRIYNLLQNQLDDQWTVFHSYTMLGRNREQKLIDAEIDFLLFHPTKGILIFEVKGGSISCRDGKWYSNSHQLKQSPADQAKHGKYNILKYLSKKLGKNPSLPVAHAVCFPDCYGDLSLLPPDTMDIAINGDGLSVLREEIERILNAFSRGIHFHPNPKENEKILNIFKPCFEYGVSISDRIHNDERTIFRLTEEQCKVLDFIANQKQALIQGCAGSGKTVMAVKKAKQLARSGDHVLFLCFNALLCHHIQQQLTDFPNVRVNTYHKFCMDELKSKGINIEGNYSDPEFWNERIPALFADMIAEEPLKYEALIVDEAQDFREDYWISISDLVQEDGSFYIFYDPEQNLFDTQLKLPILSPPFVLTTNCRNSQAISKYSEQYIDYKVNLANGAPTGIPVELFCSDNPTLRRKQLSKILAKLTDHAALRMDQIVILGGHSMDKTCLNGQSQIGKHPISENGESANAIAYYSLMKFKGCEADAVILIDVKSDDERWCAQNLYTATTRAKHLLYIIATKSQ